MAQTARRYDRRFDHARDKGAMSDRFPPKRPTDNLVVHAPEKFEPKEVLRRSGLRFKNEGKAAVQDVSGLGSALEKIGAGDLSGSAANVLVVFVGGLFALLLLNMLISDRGSTLIAKTLSYVGGGLNRLVSPSDPLTGSTRSPAATVNVNPATNPQAAGPPAPKPTK